MIKSIRGLIQIDLLVLVLAVASGCGNSLVSDGSSSTGMDMQTGTFLISMVSDGTKTFGDTTVTFERPFKEPPIVVVNQFGQGGWHSVVHALSTVETATFDAVLVPLSDGSVLDAVTLEYAFIAIGEFE